MTLQDQPSLPRDSLGVVDVRDDTNCDPSTISGTVQITKAIAAVMKEVHTVSKKGQNTFHRYRYARMEDILRQLTPLLGKHGLVIFQNEVGRSMFDNDAVIAVTYEFMVAHESGEAWPHKLRQTGVSRCRDSKGGWDDKSLNKCHTAARKYFLLALFQIPTAEDADEDAGTPHGSQPENDVADTQRREAKAWTTKFLAHVRQTRSPAALNEHLTASKAALERLALVEPEQRKIADSAVERRRAEFAPTTKDLPPFVTSRQNHMKAGS